MTIQLHAQPYDITAMGFYFSSSDEYQAKAEANRNDFGDPVEEYEIQFIDGEGIDCELAKAWWLHQGNFAAFLLKASEWDDDQKTRYIIAVGECGFDHIEVADAPEETDIDLYDMDSMSEFAEHFVEEGLFGSIPDYLASYLDYAAIASDLAFEYTLTTVSGRSLIYRCS